jgi:CHAT domain-containing protein
MLAEKADSAWVREAALRADVLHVAAHGAHQPDNPLFSCLELFAGPLFGHDWGLLSRLPAHLVLSACHLGLAVTRPGDETLGMTAALLHSGARSVVAGVARVPDPVAHQVAATHHAALRAGLPPAAALAKAVAITTSEHPVALVCYGAGW